MSVKITLQCVLLKRNTYKRKKKSQLPQQTDMTDISLKIAVGVLPKQPLAFRTLFAYVTKAE